MALFYQRNLFSSVTSSLKRDEIGLKHNLPAQMICAIVNTGRELVNARQVEKLGLGKVLDYKDITAGTLRDAAFTVMEDRAIRENLRKIQEEIAQAPGNASAVEIIDACEQS